MKSPRFLAFVMSLLLLMSLAGCGGASKKEEPASSPAPAAAAPAQLPAVSTPSQPEKPKEEDKTIRVSTVEELFGAIAPGAVIELAPGTYNISEFLKENEKVTWDYVEPEYGYDGWQANILWVEDLTIRGAEGGKVELVTEPRYADVLNFQNCSNVTIGNMTIGHTVEKGSCEGAVLSFGYCRDITMDKLDLYGCGTYGFEADHTTGIKMKDSTIRDCSYGIVDIYFGSDILFQDCSFRNNEGFDLVSFYDTFARFDGCTFSGNKGTELLPMNGGDSGAIFEKCSFDRWESQHFNTEREGHGGYVIGEGCTFKTAVGGRVVHVDNMEDLIENIAPNTVILLEPGKYCLSDTLASYWASEGESFNDSRDFVHIESEYDGFELVIRNVSGLTIASASGKCADTEIVTDPRYADVLGFEDCSGIGIMNLTMGHTDTGECAGNVLYFSGCSNIVLSGLDLYGCGVYGIETNECAGLSCFDSTIRDCSSGALALYAATGRQMFINCDLTGSSSGGYFYADEADHGEFYFFRCTFGENESNSFVEESYNGVIITEESVWDENTEFPDGEYDPEWSGEYEPVALDTTKMKVAPFDKLVLTDEHYYLCYQTVNTKTGEVSFEPDSDMKYLTFEEDGTGIFALNDGTARSYHFAMDSDYSCVLSFDDGPEASFGLYADQGGALPDSQEGSIWLALYMGDEVLWFY